MSKTFRRQRLRPAVVSAAAIPANLRGNRKPITRSRYAYRVVTASAQHLPLRPASGNKKMGADVIQKGPWKGIRLFYVALEEGVTCFSGCMWKRHGLCGASNYAGYRFRVNKQLFKWIERQIRQLLKKYPHGIVVRLHVSGDFPSAEYVRFWARMLRKHSGLRLWGHTHHRGAMLRLIDEQLNQAYANRALIRSSDSYALPYAAVTVYPLGRVGEMDGLVCPGALARSPGGPIVKRPHDAPLGNCATCAACWSRKCPTIIWSMMVNGKGYAEAGKRIGG